MKKYIKATATFESGKQYTYEYTSIIDIMMMKARIEENDERRTRLGMKVDKLVSYEITK